MRNPPHPCARCITDSRALGNEALHIRATAPRPRLSFADEPTGNLDARTGADIVELLFARRAETGATLVIITHDASLAERCERVVTLADGRIAGDSLAA